MSPIGIDGPKHCFCELGRRVCLIVADLKNSRLGTGAFKFEPRLSNRPRASEQNGWQRPPARSFCDILEEGLEALLRNAQTRFVQTINQDSDFTTLPGSIKTRARQRAAE